MVPGISRLFHRSLDALKGGGKTPSKAKGAKIASSSTSSTAIVYEELLDATSPERELPCMLLLDSAKCHRAQHIFANLRMYLQLVLFGSSSIEEDPSQSSIAVHTRSVEAKEGVNTPADVGMSTDQRTKKKRGRRKDDQEMESYMNEPPVIVDLSIEEDDNRWQDQTGEAERVEDPPPATPHEIGSQEQSPPSVESELTARGAFVAPSAHSFSQSTCTAELPSQSVVVPAEEISVDDPARGVDEPLLLLEEDKNATVTVVQERGQKAARGRWRRSEMAVNTLSLPGFSLAVPLQVPSIARSAIYSLF
jgi:hypothetical protein